MKCGIGSLLAWEKKYQETKITFASIDEKELADEIRAELEKEGHSEEAIIKNIKMALSLV